MEGLQLPDSELEWTMREIKSCYQQSLRWGPGQLYSFIPHHGLPGFLGKIIGEFFHCTGFGLRTCTHSGVWAVLLPSLCIWFFTHPSHLSCATTSSQRYYLSQWIWVRTPALGSPSSLALLQCHAACHCSMLLSAVYLPFPLIIDTINGLWALEDRDPVNK